MASPELLQLAAEHRRAGRLAQAKEIYQNVLVQEPSHAVALFFLGVISQQLRETDAAINFLRRAVDAKPDFAEAQCNLGALLAALNRSDEAITPLRAAVQYQPANVDALFNLAAALGDCERYDEAIVVFQRLIDIRENFADAHYELGNMLVNTSRVDEAIQAYERAITLDPTLADAFCNLGAALCERGEYSRAIAMANRVISLFPEKAVAYSNLAEALRHTGRYDEAIAACSRAIKISPNFFDSYVNLAAIFIDQRRPLDAIDVCRKALARNENSAAVHAILSELLREQKNLEEAEEHAHRAIACDSKFAPAHRNLGNIYKDQGRMSLAVESFRRAVALRPTHANIHSTLAFAVNYCCEYDSSRILSEARAWAEKHEKPLASEIRPLDVDRAPERRLRIGYVSADLRDHPVGRSLLPLLTHHDREQYQIICYSNSTQTDAVTNRLRAKSDDWHNIVGTSDQQLAEQIRRDKIDILVDLSLHTGGNRLLAFARKPAPVQITWLGYPGTTGMQNMNYRLTDPWLDPLGQGDSAYGEKSIRLPDTFWCFDAELMNAADIPPVGPLPAIGNGYVTFGCLNNFCKINQPLLDLWKRVLDTVPSSRLLLLAAEGSVREWVATTLGDRIDFVPHAPRSQYLQYYQRIDIGLDTLPYGGHTTSFDSFWMGVPVISLIGQTVVGRAGFSLLSNLGLADLAVATPERFVALATHLASDMNHLNELRQMMRERAMASSLMNGRKFTRDVESIYRNLWRRWALV
jgi:protein O-GlcNAc transferase